MNAEHARLDQLDEARQAERPSLDRDNFGDESVRDTANHDFNQSGVIASVEGEIDENGASG